MFVGKLYFDVVSFCVNEVGVLDVLLKSHPTVSALYDTSPPPSHLLPILVVYTGYPLLNITRVSLYQDEGGGGRREDPLFSFVKLSSVKIFGLLKRHK